jgi:membrane protein
MINAVKRFARLLGDAFSELKKNDPLRLAAATAFFTTFALPPILIILLQLFGMIFNIEHLRDRTFMRIGEILGEESSEQIRQTFLGFKAQAKNWFITVGGVVFFMFVATTLFKVIKDSLNQLWNIKVDSRSGLRNKLQQRVVSMIIILLAGLLFIGGMVGEGVQALLGKYLNDISPLAGSTVNNVLSKLISILIVTAWFAILFKVLPDAKPSWKVVIWGGFFTGILFTAGKIIIRYMLTMGDIHSVFGTSTSIVILLLFVFYSSFILYFGACFTKAYAALINDPIQPAEHAFKYDLVEKKSEPQERTRSHKNI